MSQPTDPLSPAPEPSPPSPSQNPPSDPLPAADSSTGSSANPSPAPGRIAVAPGPAFDDENRPQGEVDVEALAADGLGEVTVEPGWDEQVVRQFLETKGEAVHSFVAVDPDSDEWRYTERDLKAIAPPLTRILNRYDATRAAASSADELAVGIGFIGYGIRSIRERREAVAELAPEEPQPIAGVREDLPAPVPEQEEWTNPLGPTTPDPGLVPQADIPGRRGSRKL